MAAPYLEPVSGFLAFTRNDASALHSQAAFILYLADQVRRLRTPRPRMYDTFDEDEVGLLEVPTLRTLDVDWNQARAESWTPYRRGRTLVSEGDDALLDSVRTLYGDPTPVESARVINAALQSSHALVRASGAAADLHAKSPRYDTLYAPWHVDSLSVLLDCVNDDDELVHDICVAALDRATRARWRAIAPTDPSPSAEHLPSEQSESIIIHGTFARPSTWWRPGAPFHQFLSVDVVPDLYAGPAPYSWSGVWSLPARQRAAHQLLAWTHGQPVNHVFAHSHGGNIALMATHLQQRIERLVLLSCPFMRGSRPDFRFVGDVVSVRTKLDPITLIAGGRPRHQRPRFREIVLPIYFHHSATHDPDIWIQHGIAANL